MYRVLVFTAHRTMVEPIAEVSSLEEALQIDVTNWVFFGIDYVDAEGIPHLIKDGGLLS